MSKKRTSSKKSKPVAGKSMKVTAGLVNLHEMEDLLSLVSRYGVRSFEVENDKGRIGLEFHSAPGANDSRGAALSNPATYAAHIPFVPPAQAQQPAPKMDAPIAAPSKAASDAMPATHKKILSPLVGTFYRASKPGASPLVQPGQVIKKGQPLCIVEAMKLMNEIESEFAGKVISVLIENGEPIEFGEPLFVIDTAG